MSLRSRLTPAALACGLLLSACGGGDEPSAGAERQAESPSTDYAEFCAAATAAAQYGVTDPQDLTGYADRLEVATAVAPSEVSDYYESLTSFTRDLSVDPTAPGTAERAGELFGEIVPVSLFVKQNCDLDLFDPLDSEGSGFSDGSEFQDDLSDISSQLSNEEPARDEEDRVDGFARMNRVADVFDSFAENLDSTGRSVSGTPDGFDGTLTMSSERSDAELGFLCAGLRAAVTDANLDLEVSVTIEDDAGNTTAC